MNITNDIVTDYLNGFYRPVNDSMKKLREDAEKEIIPIILKETESFLTTLLELKKPKKILEIGTAIGYSAIYFALMCPDAEIYTIEKEKDMAERALTNIREAGLEDRIRVLVGDGGEKSGELYEKGCRGFDLVFIDAAKSHYRRFFDSALKMCRKNALIISDNILQRATTASDIYDPKGKHRTNVRNMREFLDYISNDRRFITSLLSTGDGLALTLYRGDYE